MDEIGIDTLDDEALLELMRKRREEASLREQSISSGNPLGRIIAGAAGGLEAAMTGGSGAQAAMRGMEYVDQNQRRIAALQSERDSKEMANLTALARIRAAKQQREQASQDAYKKMQDEYKLKAEYGEIGPMKDARERARLAMMSGDKRMMLDAQREMKQAEMLQRGDQFGMTMEQKRAELEQRAAEKAAELEQRASEKAADDLRRRDEIKAITDRLMQLEDKRQTGATGRTEITAGAGVKKADIAAAAKAAPKAAKAGRDESGAALVYGYDVLPGASPTDQDAKEVKKISSGINGANSAMNKLRESIRKNGVRSLPGSKERKELNSIAKSVVIDMKEAANLGALAGPDMDLVLGMMGDPTGLEAAYMGDADYLKVLDQAQDLLNEKHGQKVRAYGFAPKGGTLPAARGGVSGDQAGLRDIEKRAGAEGETRMINGKQYRKVPGGWQKVK